MLVLDQTPSCRYFYFDVWFSNFNWFSEMSLLLTGSIKFGNILWIITADLFKPKVEQIFPIKYNLLKIVPSTSSSFVQCLTVNVHMICKSYKVLVLQKKQICGNISCFAETEVWSFDFGHYQPRASQIKVNMNIFWVISPSLQQNINSTQNLENKNTLF